MAQTVCQRKRGNSILILHLTCGKKGAANDESMLFRPPTTMIMQLSPLSGVPSYTDEHANPRNFTVAKLLHALLLLAYSSLTRLEIAFPY